jgi:hypothetical protein
MKFILKNTQPDGRRELWESNIQEPEKETDNE